MPDRPLAFKVDENLPEDVAAAFRDAGYEASTARSQGLAGVEDARLMEVARQERRVFVTLDVDFGTSGSIRPMSTRASSFSELTQQDKTRILGAIRRMLPLLTTEAVTRRL